MNQELFNIIQGRYVLKERNLGKYQTIKKPLMRFRIESYEVKGIGSLSLLSMKAMFGLMKMESVIFCSFSKDLPLINFDMVKVGKKLTEFVELYNTNEGEMKDDAFAQIKETLQEIQDGENAPHWYDSIRSHASIKKVGLSGEKANSINETYLKEYLAELESSSDCNVEEKKKRTEQYVENLFKNGGPSTDQFKKMLGEEEAKEVFRKYIFGVEE